MLEDHCLTSKNPKIQVTMIWPYSGLMAFMALRLKSLRSAEFLCQNGPNKAKNHKISISAAVALSMAFEKILGLFLFFLEVLDT
jgi:hypothetical protein